MARWRYAPEKRGMKGSRQDRIQDCGLEGDRWKVEHGGSRDSEGRCV